MYLDSAATSQKPNAVIDAEANFYRTINAGVHRGAHELAARSTMAFEEARVMRSVSNHINRQQNFEDANMNKAAAAAAQQLLDIEFIRLNAGLDSLPPKLRGAAELRINNPEATLSDLDGNGRDKQIRSYHRLAKTFNHSAGAQGQIGDN